jgi:flagellar motor switch protein FliM
MLTQTEINALIAGVGGGADTDGAVVGMPRPTASKAVKTYDFRRPDKFSKDQLRTLHAIHESIGRVAASTLSARLRCQVSLTLADTSQMIFDEFISGLTLPTQLVVLQAVQLGGPILLDLDLALAKGWIDRLLGGEGKLPTERREPTSIESALILRLVDDLLPAITEGWSQVETVTPVVAETALRPDLLRVAAPSHVVAVLTFEVRYTIDQGGEGNRRTETQISTMSICLPSATLEPVLPRLSATAWYAQTDKGMDSPAEAELEEALQSVEVPLTAILGGVELSVDELAGLKPGDVIRFGERADHPVRLSVMDQAMAWAVPGKVGDRMALRLLTPMQQLLEV